MIKLKNWLNSTVIVPAIFVIFSIILIIIPNICIGRKSFGALCLIFSTLFLAKEVKRHYFITLPDIKHEFKSKKHKDIAWYLTKHEIKYVYPKIIKINHKKITMDFYLPEYDIYLNYLTTRLTDKSNDKLRKLYTDEGILVVELDYFDTYTLKVLDWKFSERMLKLLKKS
ncbi:hypothetical protein HN587_06995 [Candidatus Woesearchaeota archaeon]|jgi:hypothetical protein|nr:hypothetical protein [Candidatus Woesearchaeota archaeon]